MIVYKCDLCGAIKECLQKEIEGKEYDICADCWSPLEEKLKGKGRPRNPKETVLVRLPSLPKPKEEESPLPHVPPVIWYRSRDSIGPP